MIETCTFSRAAQVSSILPTSTLLPAPEVAGNHHVGVFEAGIKGRKRQELPIGRLEQHQRRSRCSRPWQLQRQQIRGVRGEQIEFPPVFFRKSGQC